MLLGANYNVLLVINRNNLCRAVCIAGVIQVPGLSTEESCIDNMLIVDGEHVAITNTFFDVPFFSEVGDLVTNDFADVLNYDVKRFQIFEREETDSVDLAWSHFHFGRQLQ